MSILINDYIYSVTYGKNLQWRLKGVVSQNNLGDICLFVYCQFSTEQRQLKTQAEFIYWGGSGWQVDSFDTKYLKQLDSQGNPIKSTVVITKKSNHYSSDFFERDTAPFVIIHG